MNETTESSPAVPLTTADDLANLLSDLRPDLEAARTIASAEARDAMHATGRLRYESLTDSDIDAILAIIEQARIEEQQCVWCGEARHYGDCDDTDAPEIAPCDCGVSRPDRATAPDGGHTSDCASRRGCEVQQ